MKFFAIFSPPQKNATAEIFAQTKVSPLGFRWRAFLFGPLYAAARGWWSALALWLGFFAILAGLVLVLNIEPGATALILVIAALGFGFEAERFEQAALEKSGLSLAGLALGDSCEDAEIFYLARADR